MYLFIYLFIYFTTELSRTWHSDGNSYPIINTGFLRDVKFLSIHKKYFSCVQVSDKPSVGSVSIHRHFLSWSKIVKKYCLAFFDVI